mmetsp:Transcript_4938/g.9424  ORF Transcript_4938/g.9424 Transcript_4938/m.9424 type:complete len:223 (+) Transcript_4938:3196-3864(+)
MPTFHKRPMIPSLEPTICIQLWLPYIRITRCPTYWTHTKITNSSKVLTITSRWNCCMYKITSPQNDVSSFCINMLHFQATIFQILDLLKSQWHPRKFPSISIFCDDCMNARMRIWIANKMAIPIIFTLIHKGDRRLQGAETMLIMSLIIMFSNTPILNLSTNFHTSHIFRPIPSMIRFPIIILVKGDQRWSSKRKPFLTCMQFVCTKQGLKNSLSHNLTYRP